MGLLLKVFNIRTKGSVATLWLTYGSALILAKLFGYKDISYLEFDDEALENDPNIEKLFS
jgi:hypothetical protein